jgi:hypothetical protein
MERECATRRSRVRTADMSSATTAVVTIVLVVAVIAAAVAVDVPLAAVPIVFLILFVWGGGRMASARGRTG